MSTVPHIQKHNVILTEYHLLNSYYRILTVYNRLYWIQAIYRKAGKENWRMQLLRFLSDTNPCQNILGAGIESSDYMSTFNDVNYIDVRTADRDA